MLSNHLILCCPLVLLHSVFPSMRIFSYQLALHIRWSKYWSFSCSNSPSKEYSGLISLRVTGWISLQSKDSQGSSPAPQLKSINSSALSLLYGPTLTSIHDYWKNHSSDYTVLCQQSDVSAFNMLSRFVIAFLPRNKHLLISWLWSPIHSDLGAQENKICYCFQFFPSICCDYILIKGSLQPEDTTIINIYAA